MLPKQPKLIQHWPELRMRSVSKGGISNPHFTPIL
jgi:hypothetical protein